MEQQDLGALPLVRSIGVIGGGQLARMMLPAAIELGIELQVLAEKPDESAPREYARVSIGGPKDREAILEFARGVDAVTFDHEHVAQSIITELEDEGVAVYPGSAPLLFAQNKLLMRERMAQAGLPCPRWWKVSSIEDVERALREAGGELVLKTPTGGYDGHGVSIITSAGEAAEWLEARGELLAEEKVPFTRELSAQVARSSRGEVVAYPVVESIQKNGVCFQVIAPAPHLSESRNSEIQQIAVRIAEDLGVVGMLAVELFERADGSVAINELAMRPHNTGHWSMDGANTGQFEQHVRAVAGMPLGSTKPVAEQAVMVNLLGGSREDLLHGANLAMKDDPEIKVHLYGKSVSKGRKVGHVNLSGSKNEGLIERALRAAETIINVEGAPES